MGYTTEFQGTLTFNKPLPDKLKNYINQFSRTRRMMRDPDKIKEMDPDWKDHCFNGNLGDEGEFYVVPEQITVSWLNEKDPCTGRIAKDNTDPNTPVKNWMGQASDKSVINSNLPPTNQPSLWCCWYINDDGELEWDGSEKFYDYVEWLQYLINNFIDPEGYIANGSIYYSGEDMFDTGSIIVEDNVVQMKPALYY